MTIIKLTGLTKARPYLGFSMIDVLIAIVVLTTGLLALGLLQGTITRNNADARARSLIAAYSEGVIDQLRAGGYDSIGASSFPAAANQPVTSTISPATTTCPDTTSQAKQAYCAQTAAGVSNLSTTISVKQYAVTSSTNPAFVVTAGSPTSDSGAYKQVNVTSTWNDATGQARSMSFDTTVSPVTVDTTNTTLDNTDFPSTVGNSPIVRETNPAATLGVIPIAINTTTSTNSAATNPQPVVSNTGTTFSTYTYAPSTLDTTTHPGDVISKRVDTKVIQCSCKSKANGGVVTTDPNLGTILAQPYRPTYWDGAEYTTPAASSSTTSLTGVDSSATQDAACDICCRDRNDSTSDTLKFDSFSNDYDGSQLKHYNYESGTLTEVYPANKTKTPINNYLNTCRLIRIDGAYATATDAHNYFFGLLPTDNCANQGTSSAVPTNCTSNLDASDIIPSSTTETTYASWVIAYLYGNRSGFAAGTGPSDPSTDPLNSDSTAKSYGTAGLNSSTLTISLPNSVSRWLYARGLYIDHLESSSTAGKSAAVEALNTAITNCGTSPTQGQLENCILPVLPFTTVNMTELANWSSSPTGVVSVSNTAVIDGFGTSGCTSSNTSGSTTLCPRRGNVTVPSSQTGSGNPSANAIATTYITNTGLTGVSTNQANTPYDTSNPVSDQRKFIVSGTGSSSGTVYFVADLTGLTWMSALTNATLGPSVSWSGTAAQLGKAATGSGHADLTSATAPNGSPIYSLYDGGSLTTPIPVSTSNTPPVGLTLGVKNFNNSDSLGTASVTCTAKGSGSAATVTVTNATRCHNYQVDTAGILIDGTAVTTTPTCTSSTGASQLCSVGGLAETVSIPIPSTPGISSTTNAYPGANQITIPFVEQSGSPTTLVGTCACTSNKGSNCSQYSYSPGTCPN